MAQTVLRIPDELLELVRLSAQKNKRSMNSEILVAIEAYLKSQEQKVAQVKE